MIMEDAMKFVFNCFYNSLGWSMLMVVFSFILFSILF